MKNTPSRRTSKSPSLKFDQRLILNQWMLKLFEVESLDKLAADLKDPIYERFSEDNQTQYFQILQLRLWEREKLSNDILRRYDENIVRHWRKITEKRNRQGHILYPKYFQYLSLLFTEVYLDRYFSNAYQLVSDLNRQVEEFNRHTPKADQAVPYSLSDLRKIAFWNATGSGKTLLMHINILQYRHYLKQYGREQELNRVILLTPNEGLSNQHLGEFELSDINAVLFSKEEQGLFHTLQRPVEIIDIHKLGEDSGVKTIAADSFEDDNLVLVDEGHRGSSGIEWKARRDQICENGFSFEYSATFGQAMKASGKKDLIQEYAKCILFDYSYKYFYKDGYGKDYRILNLADDKDEEKRRLYLTACLLVFFQQRKLFQDKKYEETRR